MANIIECKNLTKYYKNLCALDHLNFSVPDRGGIIGLLGPNGSGKTTFIKLLTGLLAPSEGYAEIAGYPIGVETKSIVSYLSDAHSLNENFTVTQELDYFEEFFLDFDRAKAEQMIEQLGVNAKQKVKALSKGTKEKLSLILTLSRNARLFILDEPIAGVDPAARDYILQTIISNYHPDATVLITTHLIYDVEPILDDFIFMGQGGKILLGGNADEVRALDGKSLDLLFKEVFRC